MYDFIPPASEREALLFSRSLIVAGLIGVAFVGVELVSRTGGIGAPGAAVLVSFGGLLLAALFVAQKITGRLHFALAATLSFLVCLISLWALPNDFLFRWVFIGATGLMAIVLIIRFRESGQPGSTGSSES